MTERIPGTALPYRDDMEGAFSGLLPLIDAAGGFSLSQLCAVTGLEGSTIQNWVKRGWVPRPMGKKYGREHLPRILLINALRENLQIEQIVRLIEAVTLPHAEPAGGFPLVRQGLAEETLYDALCEAVRGLCPGVGDVGGALRQRVRRLSAEYAAAEARDRLERVLTVMALLHFAGLLRRRAEELAGGIW